MHDKIILKPWYNQKYYCFFVFEKYSTIINQYKMEHIKWGLIVSFLLVISCNNATSTNNPNAKKEKNKLVLIETIYGDMKVMLYNETPLHRDNFIKLVKEGFYDSLLFHRVIKDFMIQGGDPDSKRAPKGKQLGNGGPGYRVDAEFVPELYHKKGALAAAREGDQVNPEKKSSGSQFYIVQGNVFSMEQLDMMEEKMNGPKKQKLFYDYINRPENKVFKSKLDSLNKVRDFETLNKEIQVVLEKLSPEIEKLNLFSYSEEQKQTYSTIGGTPHLDGSYTVFGEVIEGLNIVDSIANVAKDKFDRPLEDVIMKIKVVRK